LNNNNYLEESSRTAASDYPSIEMRMKGDKMVDLLHAGIGLATESGEFLDALKKTIYYGKVLDEVNLAEELGDLLWYIALALRASDTDFDEQMQINIDKLKARFPDKFTEYHAENRNLEAERKILEG